MRAVRSLKEGTSADGRAGVVRMYSKFTGTTLEDKLQVLEVADQRSSQVLQKLTSMKVSATRQKVVTLERDSKFRWQQERQKLKEEQGKLEEDLQRWMAEHHAVVVPVSPLEAEAAAVEAATVSRVTMRQLLDEMLAEQQDQRQIQTEVKSAVVAAQQAVQALAGSVQRRRAAAAGGGSGGGSGGGGRAKASKKGGPAAAADTKGAEEVASHLGAARAALKQCKEAVSWVFDADQQRWAVELESAVGRVAAEVAEGGGAAEREMPQVSIPGSAVDADYGGRGDSAASPAAQSGVPPVSPTKSPADRLAMEIDAAGGRTCPDPAVRDHWLQQLVSARQQYDADVAAMDASWRSRCGVWRVDPGSEHGGWSADAHIAHAQARQAAVRGGVRVTAAAVEAMIAEARAAAAAASASGQEGEEEEGEQQLQPDRGGEQEQQYEGYSDDQAEEDNAFEAEDQNNDIDAYTHPTGRRDTAAAEYAVAAAVAAESAASAAASWEDAAIAMIAAATRGAFIPTRHQVTSHQAWAVGRRHFLSKRQARQATWVRTHAQLLADAKQAFAEAAARAAQAETTAADRAAQEAIRRAAAARLERARSVRAVEDAIAASIAADLADAEAAAAEATAEKRRLQAAARKAVLAQYHAEKAEVEARLEAVKAEIEASERERRRAQVAAASDKVAQRQSVAETKQREKAAALAAAAAQLEAEKEALLEKLLASVPYREKLEQIAATSDAERLASHTASSKAAAELSLAYAAYLRAVAGGGDATEEDLAKLTSHAGLDLATAAAAAGTGGGEDREALLKLANARIREQGLFPAHGLSDKKVTSDARFRLVSALRSSGLAGSSTATQAVMALPATGRGAVAQQRNAATFTFQWPA